MLLTELAKQIAAEAEIAGLNVYNQKIIADTGMLTWKLGFNVVPKDWEAPTMVHARFELDLDSGTAAQIIHDVSVISSPIWGPEQLEDKMAEPTITIELPHDSLAKVEVPELWKILDSMIDCSVYIQGRNTYHDGWRDGGYKISYHYLLEAEAVEAMDIYSDIFIELERVLSLLGIKYRAVKEGV